MAEAPPMVFPEFRHVTVARPLPTSLALHWVMAPHEWPTEDLGICVFRATGMKGPWEEIAYIEGRNDFVDFNVHSPGVTRTYYYIIRLVSKTGRGYTDSQIAFLTHDPDNIALELVRKKNLYLLSNSGVAFAVLPRKSWGAKCGRCWDIHRQLAQDPDCPICYGQGFSGGFLSPIHVPAAYNSSEDTVHDAGLKFETDNTYIEIANLPVLYPYDVIVDRKMGIRYRIESVGRRSRRGYTVCQIAQILRIDERSIIYTIHVPPPDNAVVGRSWDMVNLAQPEPQPEVLRAPSPWQDS